MVGIFPALHYYINLILSYDYMFVSKIARCYKHSSYTNIVEKAKLWKMKRFPAGLSFAIPL
jgi:hypothetical protein